MRASRVLLSLAGSLLASTGALGEDLPPLVLEGPVPDGPGAYFELPFEVPAGVRELQIAHAATDTRDILDWGLEDPEGFRGWGGGNLEDAVVGEASASRSYLPGPIVPGVWQIWVGKAQLVSPSPGYRVEVTLRTAPTLAPADDRSPYVDAAPLVSGARFFAGDVHVHSEDSGDARPTLGEIGAFARERGLDFVVITDHNTTSHIDRLVAAQARHPDLLLVPGVEFTTYAGHATGFGAVAPVDARIGFEGVTLDDALEAFAAQGALVSINHPALDLGELCIGCAWAHGHPRPGALHGVEIATGGWRQTGFLFGDDAIAFWEALLDEGHHLAALGGSDDHEAGAGNGSPIGDPTTLVFAAELSVAALRAGILDSRTVVKLQGPDDPMIALDTAPARVRDTASGTSVTLTATVTGGVGELFRFVKNGLGVDAPVPITADPQTFTLVVVPDGSGRERVRAEVQAAADGAPRTLTSYVWLTTAPEVGCSCRTSAEPTHLGAPAATLLPGLALSALPALCLRSARRRRSARAARQSA